MKRRSFLVAGLAFAIFCMSCEKKVAESRPMPAELAKSIYTSESFIGFARNFIIDFKNMADYYRNAGTKINIVTFTNQLSAAGNNDAQIEAVYTGYSLSLDEVMMRKNKVDNDLLQLFHQNKILLKYNEKEVWEIIREGINLGWESELPAWQELRSATAVSINSRVQVNASDGLTRRVNKIDVNEVWSCLKEAAGFGSASILGIAGLQKLASEGIQMAVVTVSKWLAKSAGWIGAAIMVLDFANCIYNESQD